MFGVTTNDDELLSGVDCKQLVDQQVELINRKLNMGICAETIVSNDDISASLQSSAHTEIDNKVVK